MHNSVNVEATSFQMVGHMLVAVVSVGGDFTFQSQQFTIDPYGGLSYEGATFKIGQVFLLWKEVIMEYYI